MRTAWNVSTPQAGSGLFSPVGAQVPHLCSVLSQPLKREAASLARDGIARHWSQNCVSTPQAGSGLFSQRSKNRSASLKKSQPLKREAASLA